MGILRTEHVQVAMPPGGEAAARAFYGGLLGMREGRAREDKRPDHPSRWSLTRA